MAYTFDPLIETPRSSSYPSGTATAIHCIALFVNKLETTPKKDHQKNLQISRNLAYILRVDGGVHYPIDMIYGQELALHIVEQFLKRIIILYFNVKTNISYSGNFISLNVINIKNILNLLYVIY